MSEEIENIEVPKEIQTMKICFAPNISSLMEAGFWKAIGACLGISTFSAIFAVVFNIIKYARDL